jgi:CheY-like chemotaxis protein
VRVLVVEDNAVNQLVATGLLESIGCAVDLAHDGVEAVEMLSGEHPYAAVLMDCRMPRMDGYDATRVVRDHEPADRRVPIIAMTASVLAGERERCLEAGMDDFLTKPVDSAELERVVRRWTRSTADVSGGRPPASGGERSVAEADGVVLDRERVQLLEELTKDGAAHIHDQVAAIRTAIEADDAELASTCAHLVKGSALNLGLPLVADAASRLEQHTETVGTRGTDHMLVELDRQVERALVALSDELSPANRAE